MVVVVRLSPIFGSKICWKIKRRFDFLKNFQISEFIQRYKFLPLNFFKAIFNSLGLIVALGRVIAKMSKLILLTTIYLYLHVTL